MNYPWLSTFRIRQLYDEWETAPATAGIYVISCERELRRVGGKDASGIIYVGQSRCLRNRLWSYWEANHVASGMLWQFPDVASAVFGKRIGRSKDVDRLLGNSLVWVSTPIPRQRLDSAERAVLLAYTLKYGEPPPLNSAIPKRWSERPSKADLNWGRKALTKTRLATA